MRRALVLSLVLVAACDPGVLTIPEDPWYVTEDGAQVDDTEVADSDAVDSDAPPDTELPSDTDGGDSGGQVVDTDGGGVAPVCGNRVVEAGEECDDGGRRSGDGCSDACVVEFCGDGVPQLGLGEECDDGGTAVGDGCDDRCRIEVVRCGDGKVDVGEACDDGNGSDKDGCTTACTLEPFVLTVVGAKLSGSDASGNAWDPSLFLGNGDPRVRVTFAGQTVIETETRWEDTEPEWGDSATVAVQPGGAVGFEVIDNDWPFGDESMCSFSATWADLIAWGNTTHTFSSGPCAELRIGVGFP